MGWNWGEAGVILPLYHIALNVIFLGPPGVGKTHLAVSLALKACCEEA
jgi:DNA replication protein DnaC